MTPTLIKVYDSEREYRADKTAYNYSLLADFTKKTLRGFRKKYVDGINDEEDDTNSIRVGLLVHAKLAEDEEDFERKFYLSSLTKVPAPQKVTFTNHLMNLTLRDSTKDGEFAGDFASICEEAYVLSEIKQSKLPKFIESWIEDGGEDYYQELRNSYGKQIVTLEDFSLMERVIQKARESQPEILNHKECLNEVPIKFEYEGITFRVLIDRINLDHENKVIKDFDWKVTGQNDEQEFSYNYLKMRYHIQNFLYELGVQAWAKEFYPEYTVEPFKYVALDDKGLYDTIVHQFEFGWIDTPWTGFTHNGRTYKGIKQIVEEIEWHKSTGKWDMSRSTFDKKGFCHHKIGS